MEYITNLPIDFWVTVGTIIATIILGSMSKKFKWVDNKRIPLQNIIIGLFVFIIQYLITQDLNGAVAISGILSGGIYDIGKAISQILNKEGK